MSDTERDAVQAHIEALTGFAVKARMAVGNGDGEHYTILMQWNHKGPNSRVGPEPYVGLVVVPSNDVEQAEFYRAYFPTRVFANASNDQIVSAGLYATGREPMRGVLLPRPMRKAVRAKRLMRPKFAA